MSIIENLEKRSKQYKKINRGICCPFGFSKRHIYSEMKTYTLTGSWACMMCKHNQGVENPEYIKCNCIKEKKIVYNLNGKLNESL